MKEGLQKNSGHFIELRPCEGKNWRDKHWDDDKKVWVDDGPARFFYCTLCEQYGWGQKAICPKRIIKVPVSEEC